MPFAIAAAAMGAGAIGNVVGSLIQADAQQGIADAQLGAAQGKRDAAVGAAMPTTAELEQMSRTIQLTEQAIARQEKLLSTIDPAILEAGKQALKLMRGEEAQTLTPLRNQRAQQRQELLNQLREKLGTGAESSSTGIRALNDFDMQTASLISDAQDKAISKYLTVAAGARPNPYDQATATGNTLAALDRPRSRLVSAINGNNIAPYAGAPYAGQAAIGGVLRNLGDSASQLGTIAALKSMQPSAAGSTAGGLPSVGGQDPFVITDQGLPAGTLDLLRSPNEGAIA